MSVGPYQMTQIVATKETIIAGIAGRQFKTAAPCLHEGEPAWEVYGNPIVTSSGARLTAIKDRLLQPVARRTI